MVGTRKLRWTVAVAAGLLLSGVGCFVVACNSDDSNGVPTGSGDKVTVDVDASMQNPPNQYDGNPNSPFAPVEGGVYGTPDGYDPVGWCKSCNCEEAGMYCFGGGGSYTTFNGNCHPTAFGIGCQPLPSGCSGSMDCVCLLKASASEYGCYGVCAQDLQTVYCPHP
jgi:hypothetical protein